MNSLARRENPYAELSGGQWLKGNLHAHTNRSDGERSFQDVLDDYARRRYDFLMVSDHDIYTSPDDLLRCDAGGMVLIPGNEITANGSHLLHVNASRLVPPHPRRQAVLNEISGTDPQSFVIAAHPNWTPSFDHTSMNQLTEWEGYTGLEIYNGTVGRLAGSPYATNKWDMLLSQDRRVWGYANDDSHLTVGDTDLGWNSVYARTRTLPDIIEALRRGHFYASTGVIIREVLLEGETVRVVTENAERIVALREFGTCFAQVDSDSIEITLPSGATYVRFECWGKGETFAWTQPIFLST